jgi:hypothetical protein
MEGQINRRTVVARAAPFSAPALEQALEPASLGEAHNGAYWLPLFATEVLNANRSFACRRLIYP